MNVVLTGATGFAGGETLTQLLVPPRVERVTCVTRKTLARASPKLVTVVHSDFEAHPPALLDTLAAHDACFWALAGKASDVDPMLYTRVTRWRSPAASRHASNAVSFFRYWSGMGADRSENAWLPGSVKRLISRGAPSATCCDCRRHRTPSWP